MRRRDWNDTTLFLLADLALILLSLMLAALGRLHLPFGVPLSESEVFLPWPVYAMGALVWLVISSLVAVYNPQRPYTRLEEFRVVLGAAFLSNLTLAGLLYVTYRDVPRLLFFYSVILQVLFLVVLRTGFYLWRRFHFGSGSGRRVLIVGAGRLGQELAQRIQSEPDHDLVLVGFLDDDTTKIGEQFEGVQVLGTSDAAAELVRRHSVEEVILALPLRAHQHLEEVALRLQKMPVRVRVVPDFFDLAFFRATIEDFRGIPLIGLRDPAIDGPNRVIKRIFDLVLASAGVIVAAPVMAIIAVAIRLDSAGPALFRQQRVGENGKLFTIYKFRSMVVGADEKHGHSVDASVVHKAPDDPRITRVGRFIRRTSLDELPQLFNVLKGEMSLVGPRPELPWLVEQYEAWQRTRFAVPPGITGWWQVNGRSDRPMHLHTEDDLYYIQHYSPLLDLRILWRTIGVVLRRKGAY